MKRVIFHIDVNSAFLSWEAAYRLHHLGGKVDLREEVSAVGGDMALRHGIILAKSIPAKKYKIRTGETVVEALKKCPHLKLVPPNYDLYKKCSDAFMEILRQYSPCVEQYSIDEAFVDMTGMKQLWGEPVDAALRIRDQIREELGFTVNVGVSENKLLSKMASDFRKPDQVHTLWKHEIEEKMWPLPVQKLFFAGPAATKKLFHLGIYTIGDLAKTEPELLKYHLKKQGEILWAYANGIDTSAVQLKPPAAKGFGNSTTIAFDVCDASTAKRALLSLAETVGARLRAADVKAEVVAVAIKTFDLHCARHQMTLENATDITEEIYRCACRLFDELWDGTPIRHLGIHTSRIKEAADIRQLSMFDEIDYRKLGILDQTADCIRERYGKDAVKRAVFIGERIDHMSGGVSREKRSVDYKKIKVE